MIFTNYIREVSWRKGPEERCFRESPWPSVRLLVSVCLCNAVLSPETRPPALLLLAASCWLSPHSKVICSLWLSLISGRSRCSLRTVFRPLEAFMHRSVLSGSPANLSHELLCLYPVTDSQPGTEKVSDNSLTTKWVNGQLLEKFVLGIHFLEKGMGSTHWWGEECPILCSCSLFRSGSLLTEFRSLLCGPLSQVVTTQLFVQRSLGTPNLEMRLARVWQLSRLTEEDKRVRAWTTGCLRRFPLWSRLQISHEQEQDRFK